MSRSCWGSAKNNSGSCKKQTKWIPKFHREKSCTTNSRGVRTGGDSHKKDGDARHLAYGCKLQSLVSLRVFWTESHYYCPFRYRLGLCIKKFTKNAVKLIMYSTNNYHNINNNWAYIITLFFIRVVQGSWTIFSIAPLTWDLTKLK